MKKIDLSVGSFGLTSCLPSRTEEIVRPHIMPEYICFDQVPVSLRDMDIRIGYCTGYSPNSLLF